MKERTVFAIYQGEEYRKRYEHKVKDAVEGEGEGEAEREWRYETLRNASEFKSYWDLLSQTCLHADAAIAILTSDPRPASKAGNLWFEIGLWFGMRSPRYLKILLKGGEDCELISDLKGMHMNVESFKTMDELKYKIRNFLLDAKPEIAKDEDLEGRKLSETFLSGEEPRPLTEFQGLCKKDSSGDCAYSMLLASDYLRLKDVFYESAFAESTIRFVYLRISKILEYVSERHEDFTHAWRGLKAKCRDLNEPLRDLRRAARWLKESYAYEEEQDPEGWIRLKEFLERRVVIYANHLTELDGFRIPLDDLGVRYADGKVLSTGVERFVNWAQTFEAKETATKLKPSLRFGSEDSESQTRNEHFVELDDISEFANCMAKLLHKFRSHHQEQLDRWKRRKSESIERVMKHVKEIYHQLPHNCDSTTIPPIWPAKWAGAGVEGN